MIASARGFALALGCIQALQCYTNCCPTGITTHDPMLMHGLDPSSKANRVANYVKSILYETGVISHSCGVREPRELTRKNARIMTEKGISIPLAELYPDKTPGCKRSP